MNRLLDNLPYITEDLRQKGLFAYLVKNSLPPLPHSPSPDALTDEGGEKKKKKGGVKKKPLKIKRYLSLYNGPNLWDKCEEVTKPSFFLALRIFATPETIVEYLSCREYVEFCTTHGIQVHTMETLVSTTTIINEDNYSDYEELIAQECLKVAADEVSSSNVSIDDLEETLKKIKPPQQHRLAPKKNLKQQYGHVVSSCPSKVIDVSTFGKTVDKTYGKILDRIRDKARIARCVTVSPYFPVVSDNLQSFERAMSSLGPTFINYVTLFKESQKEAISS